MLRFLQVNLNCSRGAHAMLEESAGSLSADLLLVSEPNIALVNAGGWIRSDCSRAAILVRNSSIRPIRAGAEMNFAWLELADITVVSCYYSPNAPLLDFERGLMYLQAFCARSRTPLIVVGDFNAKSPSWNQGPFDRRGRLVEDWAATLNLQLLNDGVSATFIRGESRSTLDLTWATNNLASKIQNWIVRDDETLSDHCLIQFELHTGPNPRQGAQRLQKPRWIYEPGRKDALCDALKLSFEVSAGVNENPAAFLTNRIDQACWMSLRNKKCDGTRKHMYWWNDAISELRTQCNQARRRVTRARRRMPPTEFAAIEESWKLARGALRRAIQDSKRACFQQLLEELNHNPWGDAYKVVRRRIGGKRTTIPEDTVRRAVSELFPVHPTQPTVDIPFDSEEIPPFTANELLAAADKLAPGKAPGPDGIPSEVVKLACKECPEEMLGAFNLLVKAASFPAQWKEANLVLIPKPPKPSASQGALNVRPICLLNTLAKLYEQLILSRLTDELERVDGISSNQYGFRQGRSTEQAISHVMQIVDDAAQGTRRTRRIPAVVLLDVRNAFNSASWHAINTRLRHLRLAPYLRALGRDYLTERCILVELAQGEENVPLSAGVPQGSKMGPIYWNIVYDPVIRLPFPEGVELVAYADDIAVVVVGKTADEVMAKGDAAIRMVVRYLESINLHIAPEKTEAIVLAGRRQLPRITFQVQGHTVTPQKKVKYLGVWLDSSRRFLPHVAEACDKAVRMGNQLSRLMLNTRGPRSSLRRCYAAVLSSVALYAVPAWERALTYGSAKKCLASVDRISALRVISGYRTVSTAAALVLASLKPLWVQAAERADRRRGVAKKDAEEAGWNKWQRSWEAESVGGWTRRLIPVIKLWANRPFGELNYFLTQAFTGHGVFRSFLHRIGKLDSAECPVCPGCTDDPEHALFFCVNHEDDREVCWRTTGPLTPDTLVGVMCEGRQKWEKIAEYIMSVIKLRQDAGL